MASHEHLRIFMLLTIAARLNLATSDSILEKINMKSIQGPVEEDWEQEIPVLEKGEEANALATSADPSQDALLNNNIQGLPGDLDSPAHWFNNREDQATIRVVSDMTVTYDRRGKDRNKTLQILKGKDNDVKVKVTEIKGNETTRGMRSSVSHYDWMSRVDGRLNINFLSIPGSHDTMSYQSEKTDLMGMVMCQDKNLYEQMSLGLRFFDIRLSDSLSLFHGAFFLKSSLHDVLNMMEQFLHRQPTETVIFRYKREHNDVDLNKFKDNFNAAVRNKKSVIYGHDNGQIDNKGFPTLDEVRGKIVILNYKGYNGTFGKNTTDMQMQLDNYNGKDPPGSANVVEIGDVGDFVETFGDGLELLGETIGGWLGLRRLNRWLAGWVASKAYKVELSQRLVRAKSRRIKSDNIDKLWLTWASAFDNKCGPKCVAKGVNPFLNSDHSLWVDGSKDYIDVGIVVLDFPTTWTSSLPTKIYQRNFKVCAELYEHGNSGGAKFFVREDQLGPNTQNLHNHNWGDKISSYRLNPKCTLTYWEHSNYQGFGRRVENPGLAVYTNKFIGATWNDRISSLKCTCQPTAPWHSNGRCGSQNPLTDGRPAQCEVGKCCSNIGWCGTSAAHCYCQGCKDFRTNSGTNWVRLSSYPKGRVELYKNGHWGTLCGHYWWDNQKGAENICKALGYGGGTKYTAPGGHGPIQAGNRLCKGGEATVWGCPLKRAETTGCTHFIDQGVSCT